MISYGQILKLKPGSANEYKRRHDELWPEMNAVMQKAGINMVIYLYENLLFLYANAPSPQAWDQVNQHPITPRWDEYMSDLLESDGNGHVFVQDLPQMFRFGNLI